MAEMVGVWTEEQNDAIVADYFAMLADDIAGRPYALSSASGERRPRPPFPLREPETRTSQYPDRSS